MGERDSASLSAFFFYVHNVISLLILYCFDSPVPSCEEGAGESKPSPGCAGWDRFAITYYNILLR